MVLVFLGSLRATLAVSLSIPLSALAAFIALFMGGSSINSMVLAGLALAFSRLIDNSVIVLENIFRHLEMGEPPEVAAEKGGQEVSMAVLAATLTTAVVFFPVTFLYGVGRYLFSALALAVVLALFASYFVAMTVVPLFCARLISAREADEGAPEFDEEHEHHRAVRPRGWMERFDAAFNRRFRQMLDRYDTLVRRALTRPMLVVGGILGCFVLSLGLFPLLGVAFFPRTDAGQFQISLKAPSGSRLEVTNTDVAQVEALIRQVVAPADLKLIVSNIGVIPGFSSIYTSNAGPHTATVLVALNEDHKIGSYEYMDRVRRKIASDLPQLSAYFQSGGLQDAVLNQGLPAPIDIQVSGSKLEDAYRVAGEIAGQIRKVPGVSDVFIPQDLDYPALKLGVDRTRASELGLSQREVVDNIITALTSNGMIAPSYWIDPRSGNDYMLTVQYPEKAVRGLEDLRSIPLHAPGWKGSAVLGTVSTISRVNSPTEIDHYQIQRVIDIYVNPAAEDLGELLLIFLRDLNFQGWTAHSNSMGQNNSA